MLSDTIMTLKNVKSYFYSPFICLTDLLSISRVIAKVASLICCFLFYFYFLSYSLDFRFYTTLLPFYDTADDCYSLLLFWSLQIHESEILVFNLESTVLLH